MEDQYSAKFYEKIESKLPDQDLELIAWQYSFEISRCISYLEELQYTKSTPRLDVKHPLKKCDETKRFQEGPTFLARTYKLTTDDFNKALKEMLDPHYQVSDDTDKFYNHLIVAGEFFSQYGTRHPSAKITELMKLSTSRLVAGAHELYAIVKTKVEGWSIDQHLDQMRIMRGAEKKRQGKAERMRRVFEIDDQLHPKYTAHGAAKEILKRWNEQKDGPITARTIQTYFKEAGRRTPKVK